MILRTDWRGVLGGFMCFSATANFVGCAVLGTIGVATLVEVKQRRELLLAAVPCLFALHQGLKQADEWHFAVQHCVANCHRGLPGQHLDHLDMRLL